MHSVILLSLSKFINSGFPVGISNLDIWFSSNLNKYLSDFVLNVNQSTLKFDEIENIHDCHVWTMDGEFNVATIHLILNEEEITWQKSKAIRQKVKKLLQDQFNLEHITLELESISEDCDYNNCN